MYCCICIHMCVCVYTDMYTHTHTHTHICNRDLIPRCVCVCVRVYVCVYVCVCVYTHSHTQSVQPSIRNTKLTYANLRESGFRFAWKTTAHSGWAPVLRCVSWPHTRFSPRGGARRLNKRIPRLNLWYHLYIHTHTHTHTHTHHTQTCAEGFENILCWCMRIPYAWVIWSPLNARANTQPCAHADTALDQRQGR